MPSTRRGAQTCCECRHGAAQLQEIVMKQEEGGGAGGGPWRESSETREPSHEAECVRTARCVREGRIKGPSPRPSAAAQVSPTAQREPPPKKKRH